MKQYPELYEAIKEHYERLVSTGAVQIQYVGELTRIDYQQHIWRINAGRLTLEVALKRFAQ